MMKVLVTGGAGFIGRYTVDRLLQQGEQVVVVDRQPASVWPELDESVVYYSADIADQKLELIFEAEEPDYVIHLAAQTSVRQSLQSPVEDANSNIMGTVNLLQQCLNYKIQKIVYASSAAVYGNPRMMPVDETHQTEPLSFYGLSKLTSEKYIELFCHTHNLDYSILRYANVYGIRESRSGEDGVVTAFAERICAGIPMMIYGDGSQTRDFVYVKDVAEANVIALGNRGGREIMNISSGTAVSLLEVIQAMEEISGKQAASQYFPAQNGDIKHSVLDNSKARDVLWWTPKYSMFEGLQEVLDYETQSWANPLLIRYLTELRNNAAI